MPSPEFNGGPQTVARGFCPFRGYPPWGTIFDPPDPPLSLYYKENGSLAHFCPYRPGPWAPVGNRVGDLVISSIPLFTEMPSRTALPEKKYFTFSLLELFLRISPKSGQIFRILQKGTLFCHFSVTFLSLFCHFSVTFSTTFCPFFYPFLKSDFPERGNRNKGWV